MSKRILIVCDAFPPDFAPRVGNLCKYLDEEFGVTVITKETERDSWPVVINRPNFQVLRFNTKCSKAQDYLFSLSDRKLYNQSLQKLADSHFDVVLCFSYYIFPLRCAQKLARRFKTPLFIDLRDIMEQNAQPIGLAACARQFFKLRWLNQWRRNRILRKTDIVTTVSPWHVKTLSLYNKNVHLIYNGYDATEFTFRPTPTEKFIISYTGRLLDLTLRDPRLFLESVHQLIAEDSQFASNLQIRWYVDDKSMEEVKTFTREYQLEKFTFLSPTISSCHMPEVLNESSIVLVLSNQSSEKGQHGIMTTKFYEALGCEKPVLCVQSDEECLAETIERTHAGLAGRDIDEVKNFIIKQYKEWRTNGFTHQEVEQTEKLKFTRQEQAKQFGQLLRQVIDSPASCD